MCTYVILFKLHFNNDNKATDYSIYIPHFCLMSIYLSLAMDTDILCVYFNKLNVILFSSWWSIHKSPSPPAVTLT